MKKRETNAGRFPRAVLFVLLLWCGRQMSGIIDSAMPFGLILAGGALALILPPRKNTLRNLVWINIIFISISLLLIEIEYAHFGMMAGGPRLMNILIGAGVGMLYFDARPANISCVLFVCWLLSGLITGCSKMPSQDPGQVYLSSILMLAGTMTVIVSALWSRYPLARDNKNSRLLLSVAAGIPIALLATWSLNLFMLFAYGHLEELVMGWLDPRQDRITGIAMSDIRDGPGKDFPFKDRVLLRVEAPRAPGYMRSASYERYVRGGWVPGANEQLGALVQLYWGEQTVYMRPGQATNTLENCTVWNVYPTASMRDQTRFMPNVAEAVGTMADQLWLREGECYVVDDKYSATDYSLFVPQGASGLDNARGSAFTTPNKQCLTVSPECSESLDSIIEGIPEDTPARFAAAQVAANLQARCSYALGVKWFYHTDPLVQFLDQKKKGHCAMFASASCMALRKLGIPARTAAGYLSTERHPRAGYWLVRESYCHAWTEAWDKETGQWFIVDATPPDGMPVGADFRAGVLDMLKWWWVKIKSSFQKSGGLATIRFVVASFFAFLWGNISAHPIVATLIVLLLSLLFRLWMQRRRLEPGFKLKQMQKELLLIERRMRRKGLPRMEYETVHQYAQRIETEGAYPDEVAQLNAYELRRFRPSC